MFWRSEFSDNWIYTIIKRETSADAPKDAKSSVNWPSGAVLINECSQSKKEVKDHESIQSSTTPYPRYNMGK